MNLDLFSEPIRKGLFGTLFPKVKRVAAKTLALDIIPVAPMAEPPGKAHYLIPRLKDLSEDLQNDINTLFQNQNEFISKSKQERKSF